MHGSGPLVWHESQARLYCITCLICYEQSHSSHAYRYPCTPMPCQIMPLGRYLPSHTRKRKGITLARTIKARFQNKDRPLTQEKKARQKKQKKKKKTAVTAAVENIAFPFLVVPATEPGEREGRKIRLPHENKPTTGTSPVQYLDDPSSPSRAKHNLLTPPVVLRASAMPTLAAAAARDVRNGRYPAL